jgi:ATP-dependent DNA ligase
LSAEFPASLIVFDLLLDARGTSLMAKTLAERRRRLETFYRKYLARQVGIRLSPATTEIATARKWFKKVGGDLDGIVAKRTDLPYQSGNRAGMQKIKRIHTADCVVGGARFVAGTKTVASLLLGLYDKDGLLNHVGFTSSFSAADRIKITKVVTPYFGSSGFTGHAPGGPSRWSKPEKQKWQPVRPELVVEVQYDQVTGGRFRHGTRFLRWRPDKAPRQCLMKQIERRQARSLKLLEPVAS